MASRRWLRGSASRGAWWPRWTSKAGCSRAARSGRGTCATTPRAGGYRGNFGADDPLTGYGDEGGVSRFYPQFKDEGELDAWLRKLILG